MTDDAPQLRGELRTLSSVGTEARKMLGVVVAGLLTVGALVSIGAQNLGLALVLFCFGAVAWFITLFGGLKVVETDGYWLLASDQSKTVWIPLRRVASVSRVLGPGGTRVRVEVACDTPFGREIVFEPQFDPRALVGQHPVVVELSELVARAKAERAGTAGASR
jgi:hypothetical protein